MKDTELIKRIAEIVDYPHEDGLIMAYGKWINPLFHTLRAKAFCFDLMVEYNVNVFHNDNDHTAWGYDMNAVVTDISLQKAILLAVVKKHENKTN